MLSEELFRRVLIQPITELEPDELRIISGYATANMVDRHYEKIQQLGFDLSINLIIGMTINDGIEKAQHLAFIKAMNQYDFQCRYISNGNPVHAKAYIWLKNNKPLASFIGSANYTLTGFGRSQIEVLGNCDEVVANRFFESNLCNAIYCTNDEVENRVILKETRRFNDKISEDTVELSLLTSRNGKIPERSGINWGQRGDRNRNQAYIAIPSKIYRDRPDFFPPTGEQFTVLTDDGDSFIFVRAQANGKALHTTQDNSLLGKYLRARLGVDSGKYVTRDHLTEYGRSTITFTKIDNETFIMDFRPNLDVGEGMEEYQI